MESVRAAVATDQLSSIFTHGTLVIVEVSLHRQILIIHRPTAGTKNMAAVWRLYSICEWLSLVVKDALNSFGSFVGL